MTRTSGPSGADERWHRTIDSPVGGLVIVADAKGIVGVYHAHHDPAPAAVLLGCGIDPAGSVSGITTTGSEPEVKQTAPGAAAEILQRAAVELGEYFAGSRQVFELPLRLHGSDFQVRVWTDLLKIPYGERRSYRDLAEQQGNPAMGRAIGAAVRFNPVSIIVPGHRVVSSTGKVVGYASGTGTKTALLELESPSPPSVGSVGGAEVPSR